MGRREGDAALLGQYGQGIPAQHALDENIPLLGGPGAALGHLACGGAEIRAASLAEEPALAMGRAVLQHIGGAAPRAKGDLIIIRVRCSQD